MMVACSTTQYVYLPKELPLPNTPTLPYIEARELQCLSDSTYGKLTLREQSIKEYSRELRGIIEAQNKVAKSRLEE